MVFDRMVGSNQVLSSLRLLELYFLDLFSQSLGFKRCIQSLIMVSKESSQISKEIIEFTSQMLKENSNVNYDY